MIKTSNIVMIVWFSEVATKHINYAAPGAAICTIQNESFPNVALATRKIFS